MQHIFDWLSRCATRGVAPGLGNERFGGSEWVQRFRGLGEKRTCTAIGIKRQEVVAKRVGERGMGACHSRNVRQFSESGDFSGNGEEWCKKRIVDCIHSKTEKLALKDRVLKLNNESLPLDFFPKLTHVIELDLSNNKFTHFPQDLLQLSSLKILRFSHNELDNLADIHKCKTLEELVLDNNNITKLSSQIKKLRSLKYISLENNDLTYLPDELGDIPQLEVLIVSQNKIAMFPEDIFRPGSKIREIIANTNELVVRWEFI